MQAEVIDLNEYEKTTDVKEVDLIIIPRVKDDGTQLPNIMLKSVVKKKQKQKLTIELIDSKEQPEWSPHIPLDTKTKPSEYLRLIDWWFKKANEKENVYYFENLAKQYPGMDLGACIKEVRNQLENYHAQTYTEKNGKRVYSARIKDIGRKITNMLNTWQKKNRYIKK